MATGVGVGATAAGQSLPSSGADGAVHALHLKTAATYAGHLTSTFAETTAGGGDGANALNQPHVEKWMAPGVDPATGEPLHNAYIRFVNGEQGDRASALRRWQVTTEWRRDNDVDIILETGHRLFFLIKAHYPHYFFGRDIYGHPIYIERLGFVNMKALRAGGAKLKDIVWHYIWLAEFQWNVLEPAEYGSSLTILDCANIKMYDFAGEVREFVQKTASIIQEHYPERGFMVFVINVPYWFSVVYKAIEVFINPRTREKIRIYSSDYQTELFKYVDRASLPRMYGGTSDRALEDSAEERLQRNIAVRALLKTSTEAVGPDGTIMTRAQLESMLDPSVDAMAGVTRVSRTTPDGRPLCDEKGRPLVKAGAGASAGTR